MAQGVKTLVTKLNNPQNPQGRRRQLTPASCPNIHTRVKEQVCPHKHIHNVQLKKIQSLCLAALHHPAKVIAVTKGGRISLLIISLMVTFLKLYKERTKGCVWAINISRLWCCGSNNGETSSLGLEDNSVDSKHRNSIIKMALRSSIRRFKTCYCEARSSALCGEWDPIFTEGSATLLSDYLIMGWIYKFCPHCWLQMEIWPSAPLKEPL